MRIGGDGVLHKPRFSSIFKAHGLKTHHLTHHHAAAFSELAYHDGASYIAYPFCNDLMDLSDNWCL